MNIAMKQFTLVILVLLTQNLYVQAQQELYVTGKVWVYRHYHPYFPDIDPEYYYKTYVVGDTIVNETKATRICTERMDNGEKWYGAVYEDKGRVYSISNGEFRPMIDFSLHLGDVFYMVNPNPYNDEPSELGPMIIVGEEIYNIEGIGRRVLVWTARDDNFEYRCYWVDGIGAPYNDYLTVGVTYGACEELVECYDGDRLIYSKARFDELITGIDEIASDKRPDEEVYDLTGRRVANPVKGRLYVKSHTKVVW